MTTINKFGSVLGLASLLTLGACGSMDAPSNTYNSGTEYPRSSSSGAYTAYGVVQSIDLVRQDSGSNDIGLGTLAGAVVGGVVGNQVGGGRGNTAATVAGAAGGAYVGHQMEKSSRQQADAYKFTLRMSDGSYQTLTQSTTGDLRVGDRVQIDNGSLRRY